MISFDPQLELRRCVPVGHTTNPSRVLWSTYTPEGPGTLELKQTRPDQVAAEAWGPGRHWLLNQAPAFVGNEDPFREFVPPQKLDHFWRAKPFSLGRTDSVSDALVAGVFGQKVQTKKAKESSSLLARKFGIKAPGPYRGFALPPTEQLANMTYADFHPLGVERKRAAALLRVTQELLRHPSATSATPREFKRRFENVHGIGPWTTNVATSIAFGDPDAVPVGDYHLPNTVSWNLAREPRATDERMLELLAPYVGNRWRVLMLAKSAGSAPKYGPRLSLRADGISRGR